MQHENCKISYDIIFVVTSLFLPSEWILALLEPFLLQRLTPCLRSVAPRLSSSTPLAIFLQSRSQCRCTCESDALLAKLCWFHKLEFIIIDMQYLLLLSASFTDTRRNRNNYCRKYYHLSWINPLQFQSRTAAILYPILALSTNDGYKLRPQNIA